MSIVVGGSVKITRDSGCLERPAKAENRSGVQAQCLTASCTYSRRVFYQRKN